MIYRIYDIDTLTTHFMNEQGDTISDIGDANFEDIPTTAEAIALVRTERNARLQQCDYTQLPDVPLSALQIEAWRMYRQELRDMMQGFAWNVTTWPAPPW